MASGKKKLDEYHLKILRELVSLPSNKQCFDCSQRGPTYVNVTIGSFVCTTCSGMLRGLTPPHRVKSISMATFTPDEIDFVKARGNEYCRRTWLGLCDTDQPTKDEQQIKDFMIAKYERKRYYLNPSTNPTVNGSGSGSLSPNNTPAPSTPLSNVKPSTKATISAVTTTNNSISKNSAQTPTLTIAHPITFQLKPPSTNRSNSNSTSAQVLVNGTKSSNKSTNHNNNNVFTPDPPFTADFSNATTDPFSSCNSNSQLGMVPPQPNFANFENNPIFNSSSSGFAGVSSNDVGEDRYAALKDLDCLMKTQKQQEQMQQQTVTQTPTAGVDWGTNGGVRVGMWPAAANVFNSTAQGGDTKTVTSNPFTGENVWANSNSFGANPFRNNVRGVSEGVWCGVPNGQLTNGFPTSQSFDFAPTKATWNSDPISNPFTVGPNSHTTGHHSSNPFL